jgi:hypothetical protein
MMDDRRMHNRNPVHFAYKVVPVYSKLDSPEHIMIDQITNYISQVFLSMKGTDCRDIAFIGCSPRSGSTLLTRILNCHSQIASPCEIALPRYFDKGDKKKKIVNLKYKEICRYYQTNFVAAKLNSQYLINRILLKEGKNMIVMKDPRQSLFLDQIVQDFPSSKIIHLIRDARSVAMSPMFEGNPTRGFEVWYEYNVATLAATQKLPDAQKILVSYENLVISPEETMRRVVAFLGYEFEPLMLNYGQFTHADDAMSLWTGTKGTGVPAKDAPQHTALMSVQSASSEILMARQNYGQAVLESYDKMKHVQEMNQSFGYPDVPSKASESSPIV